MTKERADEIVRFTFYKYIDDLVGALTRNCDNSEVAFDVGRYVAMMQKTLETELEKEIVKESDGE